MRKDLKFSWATGLIGSTLAGAQKFSIYKLPEVYKLERVEKAFFCLPNRWCLKTLALIIDVLKNLPRFVCGCGPEHSDEAKIRLYKIKVPT